MKSGVGCTRKECRKDEVLGVQSSCEEDGKSDGLTESEEPDLECDSSCRLSCRNETAKEEESASRRVESGRLSHFASDPRDRGTSTHLPRSP